MNDASNEQLLCVRRICHQICALSCVEQKRKGLHEKLLMKRPHWSILKAEEQFHRIDLGETIPFDIALPLPARDQADPQSDQGVNLFWERFNCQCCGRCCYTPGEGLYLEESDFQRIAEHVGKKRLRSLCRYDQSLKAWILKQPCPFYDVKKKECQIYSIRPLTCIKYPLHPPMKEMPYNLAVDAFCPAAREFAKETLGWWIICENNWASILGKMEQLSSRD